MGNFKVIYRILRYLDEAMDYETPDMGHIAPEALKMTRQRWNAIMALLQEEGLIDGLTVKRFMGGAVTVSDTRPRLTLQGLTYLHSDPMMLKAAELAKGIAEHKEN